MNKREIAILAATGVFLAGTLCFRATGTRASARLPGSCVAAVGRADYVGRLAAGTPMSLTVCLKLRNTEELEQFLADLQDPGSPVYHKYLTMEQFVARYSPAAADYQRVKDFLRTNGFRITDTWENRISIGATADAAAAERAFGATMNRYHYEGRDVYAAAEAPAIPYELSGIVDGVVGLDTIYQYHTNHQAIRIAPLARGHAAPSATHDYVSYGPPDFQAIYGLKIIAGRNDGKGQSVAVIWLPSNINKSELQEFWNKYGIAQSLSTVKVVGVGGSRRHSAGANGTVASRWLHSTHPVSRPSRARRQRGMGRMQKQRSQPAQGHMLHRLRCNAEWAPEGCAAVCYRRE